MQLLSRSAQRSDTESTLAQAEQVELRLRYCTGALRARYKDTACFIAAR